MKIKLTIAILLLTGCSMMDGFIGKAETKTMEAAKIAIEASTASLKVSLFNFCATVRSESLDEVINTPELMAARKVICDSLKTKIR